MRRFLKWVWQNLEEFLGGICLAIIVIIVSINVFMRYVLNTPIEWVSELATILFVWMVMLGVSAAARRRLHPSIDVLTRLMPFKIRIIVESLVNLIVFYLLIDFTVRGWEFAWGLGLKKFTSMFEMHYTVVYLALPIGFGLMGIRILGHLVSDIRILLKKGQVTDYEQKDNYNIEEAL